MPVHTESEITRAEIVRIREWWVKWVRTGRAEADNDIRRVCDKCFALFTENKRLKAAWSRSLLRAERLWAENRRLTQALAKAPCQAETWKADPCVCPACQARAELREEETLRKR